MLQLLLKRASSFLKASEAIETTIDRAFKEPKNLDWLDQKDQDQLRDWGTAMEVEGNPPHWVGEPEKWKRAKKAVKPYWTRYSEPYKVVADLYRGPFKGKIKKKRKT